MIDIKRVVGLFRLALMITAVDLAVSVGYWGAQGVTPSRVVRSIAGWMVEADSFATPVAWVVGVLVLYAIYVAMVGALALMLALRPVSPSRWLPLGVLYGIGAYLVCYQWLVPMLIFPLQLSASPTWVAACVGLHAACFGPWMVWVLAAPVHESGQSGWPSYVVASGLRRTLIRRCAPPSPEGRRAASSWAPPRIGYGAGSSPEGRRAT